MSAGTPQDCTHERIERVRSLYVDGRPLYRCLDCDARLVDEDDEPSFKGLALLRREDDHV